MRRVLLILPLASPLTTQPAGRSPWASPTWRWGSALGDAHVQSTALGDRLATAESREAFVAAIGAGDVEWAECQLALALKCQHAAKKCYGRAHGLGTSEQRRLRQLVDDMAGCCFEGEGGAARLATALDGLSFPTGSSISPAPQPRAAGDSPPSPAPQPRAAVSRALVALDFVQLGFGRSRRRPSPRMCAADDPAPGAPPPAAYQLTPSGLRYLDVRLGHGGGPAAGAGEVVRVRYSGRLLSGASRSVGGGRSAVWEVEEKRVTLALGASRAPASMWDECLAGMRVGGSRRVLVPPAASLRPLKKGGRDTIPHGETAVYECELLRVEAGAVALGVRCGLLGEGSAFLPVLFVALLNAWLWLAVYPWLVGGSPPPARAAIPSFSEYDAVQYRKPPPAAPPAAAPDAADVAPADVLRRVQGGLARAATLLDGGNLEGVRAVLREPAFGPLLGFTPGVRGNAANLKPSAALVAAGASTAALDELLLALKRLDDYCLNNRVIVFNDEDLQQVKTLMERSGTDGGVGGRLDLDEGRAFLTEAREQCGVVLREVAGGGGM